MRASKLQKFKAELKKRELFSKQHLLDTVRVCLPPFLYSLFFAILWLKPRLYNLSYGSLDPSYIYGAQKAADMHASFGEEFTSNYGPLAYSVINFLPEHVYGMMFWHLAAVLAAGCGAYLFAKLYVPANRALRITAALLILVTLSLAGAEWLFLDLFILYGLIYLKVSDSLFKRRLAIGLAIISALFMLTKFTIGLVSIGGLAIIVLTENGLTFQDIKARIFPLLRLLLIYFVTLVAVGYFLGVTNIFAYVSSSIEVATGFGGAMGINDPNLVLATQYIVVMFVLLIAWLIVKAGHRHVYYLFMLPALFIVFKYAVTRQDAHVLVILQVVVFLAVVVYFLQPKIKPYNGIVLALIISAGAMAMWTNYTDFRLFNMLLTAPYTNAKTGQAVEFFKVGSQTAAWKTISPQQLEPAMLPASMREKIGSEAVDIFPWETVIVEANNLQWRHRPSPFSFETYTEKLDTMNQHFIETEGPKYVIWHRYGEQGVLGVDGRHLLWDGPKTVQSLLRHYNFVEADDNFILLERKTTPDVVEQKTFGTATGGGWIGIPETGGLVCVKVANNDTLKQDLYSLMLRERPFFLEATYGDGSTRSFRFVKSTSEGGLLINELPYDWDGLIQLFKDGSLPPEESVTQFRINNEPTIKTTLITCNE